MDIKQADQESFLTQSDTATLAAGTSTSPPRGETFLTQEEVDALLADIRTEPPQAESSPTLSATGDVVGGESSPVTVVEDSLDGASFNKAVLGGLEEVGVMPELMKNRADFSAMTEGYSSWKMVIANPQAVALVKKDTELQKTVLASQAEGSPVELQLEDAQQEEGQLDAAPDYLSASDVPVTAESLIYQGTNFLQTDHTPKIHGEESVNITRTVHLPIRQRVILNKRRNQIVSPSQPSAPNSARPNIAPAPDVSGGGRVSAIDQFRRHGMNSDPGQGVMNASPDQALAVLNERKLKGIQALLAKGLQTLPKSLEKFNAISSRKKFLIGVGFAGASVLTGGALSILSQGISTAGFASQRYMRILKDNEAKNIVTNKAHLAATSMLYGLALSLGTSQIMSSLFAHIEVPDVIKEKVASLKDSLKEYFSSFSGTTPVQNLQHDPNAVKGNTVVSVPEPTVATVAPEVTGTQAAPPDASTVIDPSRVYLPEYTIQPGDSLTKIIREQVLPSIPGIESMEPYQKNNIIENLLQQAKENPTSPFYATINQFADPSVIQVDKTLDLNEIRQGIVGYHNNAFGGTLLDHAKTITESVVTSTATPIPDVYVYDPGVPLQNDVTIGSESVYSELRPENSEISEDPEDLEEDLSNIEEDPDYRKYVDDVFGDVEENPRIEGLGYRNNA